MTKLRQYVERTDGGYISAKLLEQNIKSEDVLEERSEGSQLWQAIGTTYLNHPLWRAREALAVFLSLYSHMLKAQDHYDKRIHKGMPLCWIGDCYWRLGCPVLSKRYLMLALCEDAITWPEGIPVDEVGIYHRLVSWHGLPESEFTRYGKDGARACVRDAYNHAGWYPERILQELDQNWMTEYPSAQEALLYTANRQYMKGLLLLVNTDDKQGKMLELLGDYLMSCMPGCRTSRRGRSPSTDYDIVCSLDGLESDFRSELGRYFLCECKNEKHRTSFTTVAKFSRVLDSVGAKFGILVAVNGISGKEDENERDANREVFKLYHDRGIVIVILELTDLERVADGVNLINLLRVKYENVRLDRTRPTAEDAQNAVT